MVDPGSVPRILSDAAWLVKEGRIVVFGSAALAFWLDDAPRSRDIDVWVEPVERGDPVAALMGELSWYHEKHDAYVEVWAPETFAAPRDWEGRALRRRLDALPNLELVVPHPHDILLAKLERHETQDMDHARRILRAFPLTAERLEHLVRQSPFRGGRIVDARRIAAFEEGLSLLRVVAGSGHG